MANNLLFSVCIITYNQEKYISQALDSILKQEHSFPYEIVIGDDCSSDNTQHIIKEYAKKYPNIIRPIYNTKNLGIIKNYFNVIEHCSGKYIMECAGDDWWLPGKVKKQIEFMEANPDVGMCYGNVYLSELGNKQKVKNQGYTDFKDLVKLNSIPAVTICVKITVIKNYIVQVNPLERNWIMEDYPIWLWISLNGRIAYLNDFFAIYRVVENSISHQSDIFKQAKFIKSEYDVRNYFRKKKNMKIQIFDVNVTIFNLFFKQIRNKNYTSFDDKSIFGWYKKIEIKTVKVFIKNLYLKILGIFR